MFIKREALGENNNYTISLTKEEAEMLINHLDVVQDSLGKGLSSLDDLMQALVDVVYLSDKKV
jgi:hypothetical protein